MEVIEVMTYEDWENLHMHKWRAEARERQIRWNKKHACDAERRRYYCNQRFLGILIIIVALIPFLATFNLVWLLLGSIGVILGIGMIVTKKMVIVNNYWWTHGGPEQQWK